MRTESPLPSNLDEELASCMLADGQRIRRKLHRARSPALLLKRVRQQIDVSKALRAQREAMLPKPEFDDTLPIVAKRHEIEAALAAHPVVIVCGDTGSGKSTQLPKMCLNIGRGVRGFIGHTQPRRLAARSIATRLADELNTTLGGQVGYKVRFADRVGRDTFIKVLTDGMLLAEIAGDRRLEQYDTLIIDEAHERSLNIDLLLGLLKRLLPARPDLKVIVTSATIDPQRFAAHFSNAPIIEVSGRTFPVEIRYRPLTSDDDNRDRAMQAAIVHAVHELGAEGPGDILVFLPGERDIRNTAGLLRKRKPERTEILPLYARLSAADQQRIFKPHTGQRIVLATNVAETSLTVPGIRYVIDAGYARISRYTTSRQIQRLPVEPVSQASADQRAGRCGRTAPGICIRLYAEDDYLTRPRFTDPEVLRSSLAGVILMMRHLGLGDVDAFPFLDPPMSKHINDGYRLLLELGAVDENRALTPLGRRLARFPVDPRLGRMLLAAERIGCLSEVLTIAAALAVQDPRETPESARREAQQHHRRYDQHGSDFIALLALWSDYQSQTEILSNRELRRYCKQNFLSFARMGEWRDVRRQLAQVSREMELARNQEPAKPDDIHRALLSGLLGNIATLDEKRAYVGTYQKKLFVHPSSSQFNRTPKWIMAAELVDTGRLYARVTAPIKPEWVEPFAGHLLRREYLDAYFEPKSGRVMAYERATLFGLTVISRRKTHLGPREPSRAREILIREGLVEGRLTNGGAFLDHNRDLIARASQLENKVRRRDIVIDTEALFEFYDERLPPELFSAARLERWRRTAEADMPRLLYLKRADVLKRGAEKVTLERFPDTIDVNGNRLPLNYHFAPGHPNDGVTVTIPLALLNQLPAGRFTWVVPGLLHEKVIALIKSLPKPIRRRLVPAPEFAARSIEMLSPGDTPITAALADILQRLAGVTITPADWDLAKLPPHLVTSFHLVDERGATVAYGRDLAALRALHQDSAETHFSQSAGNEIEREGVTAWDFGVLPETVEIEGQGMRLKAFPALTDQENSVTIKLFATRGEAAAAMRDGLRRLVMLQLPVQLKFLRKNLRHAEELRLMFARVGRGAELTCDIVDAALDTAAFTAGHNIRDPDSFAQCVNRAKESLVGVANDLCESLREILGAYRELSARLDTAGPETSADLRAQMQHLIFPGFVRSTPAAWLAEYPRYIRAAQLRLERARRDPEKDRDKHAQLARHWDRYVNRIAAAPAAGPELTTYRWMLEEYRVSLFAQELGTTLTVSPKRLDAQWRRVNA